MVFGALSAIHLTVTAARAARRVYRVSSAGTSNESHMPYTRFSQPSPPSESSGSCKPKLVVPLVVLVIAGIIVGIVFGLRAHNAAKNSDTNDYITNNGNYDPGNGDYHPDNGDYHPDNGGLPAQPQPKTPRPDLSKGGKYASLAYGMKSLMSPRTSPCEDFYQYACGGWIAKHPADDYESHNRFEEARDEVNNLIYGELNKAVRSTDPEAVKKAKWFFRTCMDTSTIDFVKARPLQELLTVLAFHTFTSVEDTMVQMAMYKSFPIATLTVSPDPKKSDTNIITLDQPSLPIRDLKGGLEQGLRNYMEKIQTLLNRDFHNFNDNFLGNIESLLSTHKSIAGLTTAEDDRLSLDKRYRKYTVGTLNTRFPGFDWKRFVTGVLAKSGVNITDDQPVLVLADGYMQGIGEYLNYANQQEVLKFMRWNFVHGLLSYLSHDYRYAVNELFKVFEEEQMEPARWKTCTTLVDIGMANVTGRLFIDAESII